MSLDDKMWKDVVALHVTATWLDPTLKSFSFVSNSEERQALLCQAETVVEGHAVAAASDLYQKKGENDIEVTAEDHEADIEEVTEVEEKQHAKRRKYDPLLEFQNSTMEERPDAKLKKSARDLKTEVCEEIRCYNHMGGVSLHQANAIRAVGSNFKVVRPFGTDSYIIYSVEGTFNMRSMLLLRGSGGMPPRKILKNRCSEIASESIFVNFCLYY